VPSYKNDLINVMPKWRLGAVMGLANI
jgi:hypothetical protein